MAPSDNVHQFPVSELWKPAEATITVHEETYRQKGARPGASFVKGPLPTAWISACHKADTNALILALEILHLTGSNIEHPSPVWVKATTTLGRKLGLSRYQRYRAIEALEKAELADVDRQPNCAPKLRMRPWSRYRAE